MISMPVTGSTRVEDGVGIVTVTTECSTSLDDLWEAITAPERLARWFGQIQPKDDDAAMYDASLSTGWSGIIRVDLCEPPRVIRATFVDETEPPTVVSAVLAATGNGSQLTIEERGLPTDDLTVYVAGWHAQVDQLVAGLSGATPIEWRPRWEQLRADYRNRPPVQQ
ncbi:SRPBCC domain-containing protein [Arthrobacter dokdonensis]|uniref:SRPBCC domain-containing protein n=1 Tax=Arthrobacter dokdonellae TaxID=2211210 RepID=UPI000DE59471|nr:SRPBCC domain-containing protein [Arthrobacter dokdonellae]